MPQSHLHQWHHQAVLQAVLLLQHLHNNALLTILPIHSSMLLVTATGFITQAPKHGIVLSNHVYGPSTNLIAHGNVLINVIALMFVDVDVDAVALRLRQKLLISLTK